LSLQHTVDNPWESYQQGVRPAEPRRFARLVAVLVRRQETVWHHTRLHIFAPARFMSELRPELEVRHTDGALRTYVEELTRLRLWELEAHPAVNAALGYCEADSVKTG